MAEQMTLEKFKVRFDEIKEQGWVQSLRRGPRGIEYTLEQLLGMTENSIAMPSLGTGEIRAHQSGTSSLITLFTFDQKTWRMEPLEAIRQYGSPDAKGRMGLYFTLSRTPNSMGLFLYDEADGISVRHISGVIVVEWEIEALLQRLTQKFPGLIYVSTFSETRGNKEWFRFYRARLLTGGTSDFIRTAFQQDYMRVDTRFTAKVSGMDSTFLVDSEKIFWLFKNWMDI